jgi:chromosome segregation ATPase
LANLRKECEDKYARKEEIPPILFRLNALEKSDKEKTNQLENHEERIKALEDLTRDHVAQLSDHTKSLDQHQIDIDELKRKLENCIHDIGLKVDCDTFDQKIFELIALLNSINKGEKVSIPVQTGNNISSKDMQMIMEAIGKIDGLEALINKLFEDMANLDLDDIRRQLEQLWDKKADKKDVELLQSELKQKVKALEDAIAELKKQLI